MNMYPIGFGSSDKTSSREICEPVAAEKFGDVSREISWLELLVGFGIMSIALAFDLISL